MNCVYVLASSQNDLFYEQFYLSAFSLRLFNPDAGIILLIDQKTKETLTGKRSGYEKVVSETKVISVPVEFNQKEVSRWLKTSIARYVSGEFLYIDCDTIIAGELNLYLPSAINIGAVLDTHVSLMHHHLRNSFLKDNERLGFDSVLKTDNYFNGGLIYCGGHEDSKKFFLKWHNLWLQSRSRGNSQDMPSLNQANYECNNIITELGGEWNCQISHNGLSYLHDAKIIHYFATSLVSFIPAYQLASSDILMAIKETGEIPEEAMKMLENPKAAFERHSRIIADPAAIGAFDGSLFSKLIWLNKKYPKFFRLCDNFMSSLTKMVKRILGKK
jgi:hypothetical protein